MRLRLRRRTSHEEDTEQQQSENAAAAVDESSLKTFSTTDGRGKGVKALRLIPRRVVVLEYCGELLDRDEAEAREADYDDRGDTMCYTFWFRARDGKPMCIDATESKHISRFINHSRRAANLVPELKYLADSKGEETPHIVFRSKRTIHEGEELLFDYGDTRPSVIAANEWLKR